jgi:hypothetical protein
VSEPTTTDPQPATPAPADPKPAADAPADQKPAERAGEEESGFDPQLVGLAVVLWLLAMGILIVKWPRLRMDWYLGNIKEASASMRMDEPSVAAIVSLCADDPDTTTAVGDEVVGPLANRDDVYRAILVRTLGRVPGPRAIDLVAQAANDYHPNVRANAYVVLGQRAKAEPALRDKAVPPLLGAVGIPGDSEPASRAVAIDALGDLAVKDAVWPIILSVYAARHEGEVKPDDAMALGLLQLREAGAGALKKITGQALPYDPKAPLAARDAQLEEWKRWFVGQGGTVPKGQDLTDVVPKADTAPVASPAAGPPSATEGNR